MKMQKIFLISSLIFSLFLSIPASALSDFFEKYECGPWIITISSSQGDLTYESSSTDLGGIYLENGVVNYSYEESIYRFFNGNIEYRVTTYPGPGADLEVFRSNEQLRTEACNFINNSYD